MAEPKGEKRRCQHPNCKYRTKSRYADAAWCDYTYITGKNRLEGLPKEKWAPCYCDKYEPGERVRRPTLRGSQIRQLLNCWDGR